MKLSGIAKVSVGVFLGSLTAIALSFGVRAWSSPLSSIPDDQLTVLVSESCGFSRHIVQQLQERPELSEHVLAVPVDGSPQDNAALCAQLVEQVAPPMRSLVPDDVACAWLIQDAAAYHAANFAYYPAWREGERPLNRAELEEALAHRGLKHDDQTNRLGHVDEDLSVPDRRWRRRQAAPPSSDGSLLDDATGHNIGF